MTNLSGIIIMEGDTNIARLFCGCCGRSFRANVNRVVCANKQPICLPCIEAAIPKREALGLPSFPFDRSAYLDNDEEA